jgi:hypothetical protein
MKQRVEKANVKGSTERLTQPGRIAIVYSQDREASEYTQYISYLQDSGYIGRDIEDLTLDDLQGMKGLKALRAPVDAGSLEELRELGPDDLYDAVTSITS